MIPPLPISWLAAHFFADFVLQSDWMAINKSKSLKALTTHCAVYAYAVTAIVFSLLGVMDWRVPAFMAITFATHFIQDAITSRLNAKLWAAEERHWFFVSVGFDQLLHYATLALTGRYLGIL